ncbi:MAG TPA: hypothetical protein VK699_03930 [Terriglobales bacterium]|nr:hypothetical protein [Terriglobales bacterium]
MWPEIHHIWGIQSTLYGVLRRAALTTRALLKHRQDVSSRKTLLIAAAGKAARHAGCFCAGILGLLWNARARLATA